MDKEELMLMHNKMITEIITECEYMIKNRFCMNDIAIKSRAEKIKDIANYYLTEAEQNSNSIK